MTILHKGTDGLDTLTFTGNDEIADNLLKSPLSCEIYSFIDIFESSLRNKMDMETYEKTDEIIKIKFPDSIIEFKDVGEELLDISVKGEYISENTASIIKDIITSTN